MSGNVRAFLTLVLDGLLPDSWLIVGAQQSPSVIQVPTVVISAQRLDPLPAAARQILAGVTLTVLTPLKATPAAEDDLDSSVLTVCHALHDHPQIVWNEAEKVVTGAGLPAWDIRLQIITQPKE